MCFAIPLGKILVLLDAGSGMFRFAEPLGKKLLKGVEEIHIFLSHFHLDHTFGFYAAFKLFESIPVNVFIPEGEQELSDYLTVKNFLTAYQNKHANFSWEYIKASNNEHKLFKVTTCQQKHRGVGSLAYRFMIGEKEIAYVTDSEPHKEGVEFVRGVNLLLHEHYFVGSKSNHYEGGHITTVGAATIAKEAKVGRLVLIHHNPFFDDKQLEKQLQKARNIFPKTILAYDIKTIEF